MSDLGKSNDNTLKMHKKKTIKVEMIGIAFFGGLRVLKNYNLAWKDVDIKITKQ